MESLVKPKSKSRCPHLHTGAVPFCGVLQGHLIREAFSDYRPLPLLSLCSWLGAHGASSQLFIVCLRAVFPRQKEAPEARAWGRLEPCSVCGPSNQACRAVGAQSVFLQLSKPGPKRMKGVTLTGQPAQQNAFPRQDLTWGSQTITVSQVTMCPPWGSASGSVVWLSCDEDPVTRAQKSP